LFDLYAFYASSIIIISFLNSVNDHLDIMVNKEETGSNKINIKATIINTNQVLPIVTSVLINKQDILQTLIPFNHNQIHMVNLSQMIILKHLPQIILLLLVHMFHLVNRQP